MKKILLFVLIVGLVVLTSCEDKNPNNKSSNSSNPTIHTSSQSETSDNTPTSSTGDNKTSTTIESKTDGSVYDDDIPWGPLH